MFFKNIFNLRERMFLVVLLLPIHLVVLNGQEITACKIQEPPIIDGILDEKCWENTIPVTGFFQREPENGMPATVDTEIYVAYDSQHLYIGIRCFSDPEDITANELARDADLSNDDRVQVILDTYNDKRNAYWFQIGPRGSIGDAIVSENGAAFNKAWDGLWTGKARIHAEGWDAELELPFKTFNFDPEIEKWGFKLIRYQKSNEETVYWPVANINTHKFQVSDAGLITNLKNISQGVGLDLVPYGLTGLDIKETEPGASPIFDAGFEAYYNITSNLKAAVSVNTDFAQTEVDQQEINLTRFSLFYPEKRDFFLDGANYFNFGINGDRDNRWNTKLIPFFSRRIGLDVDGNPIPVQYGGKVTGQAGKWNIGAMYMKDQRPGWQNSHFSVTRFSRNIGKQSQIGMVTTMGNALYDTSNYVVGFDMKLASSEFRGDKNLSFVAYGLRSITSNARKESSLPGRDMAFGAELYYPNDNLDFRLGHLQIQENFIAGLGFVPRPGVRQTYSELTLGHRPGKWGIMQVLSGAGWDYITDFENIRLTREWYLKPIRLRLMSGDELQYRITSSFENLDHTFNLYDNYPILPGNYRFIYQTVSVRLAQKRRLWALFDYRFGQFYNGSRNEIKLKAGYNVAVPLFLGGEIIRNDIVLHEDSFTANVYRVNLNILFSPDITLYSFIQYDSQSSKMGWQSRFQWILKPGREIFLVWNSIARDPFERYQLEEAGARAKVKFTVRF
ncbi:MAG: carbohydrate binding family 9 domain-containing protein [Bacteroidales bacterium]|nr:carbohydrate binding family 9 domain-containing protein [Bacteroidales bacterium]